MGGPGHYAKRPFVPAGPASACEVGWAAVLERLQALRSRSRCVLAVECYPGVLVDEIRKVLTDGLRPALVVDARQAYKGPAEVEHLCAPFLGHYNNMHRDAAIDESVTVPEVIPLISDHRKMKSTKAPNGAGDSWCKFSADPRDTATGTTTNGNLITDELFAARPGSAPVEAYRAASATRQRGTLVHKTASKVEGVAATKADALPLLESVPRITSRKA